MGRLGQPRVRGHPAGCHLLVLARCPAIGTSRAALHAKLVAADERVALLGSANLTDKALALNLELGVIIRDPDVVRRLVRHFRSLMRPGVGLLEPVIG
jgi:putative cardiolipin synthase